MRPSILPTILLLTSGLCAAPIGGDGWLTNFNEAKALAKKEKKDLLIDFTGSDWCRYCVQLREEVFDKDEFKREIGKTFVCVEIDFPQRTKLDEALVKQNQELGERFGIQGYPTIMLTDADGMPYAQTGYQPGGPEKYLTHLGELQQKRITRDAALTKAKAAKGTERAMALAAAIDALDEGHRAHYGELIAEIVKLDADGKAGLREKFERMQADILMNKRLAKLEGEFSAPMMAKKWDEAREIVEKFIASEKPEGNGLQKALFFKAIAQLRGDDLRAGLATLEAAAKAAPEGALAPQIQHTVRQVRSVIEKRDAESKPSVAPEKKDGETEPKKGK